MKINPTGQEVVERTSVIINNDFVEARLTASLPAAGRTILAKEAKRMFLQILPFVVEKSLIYDSVDTQVMKEIIECVEDQEYLRSQLASKGLVSFVGDGSVLPRSSGISNMPLISPDLVLFKAPDSLSVSFVLPNRGKVTGMGIPCGITLISGGGFNGKSTLLHTIERGIYNHIPGDGRELVVTEATATKIRAEEGRFICNADIRPFIKNLPFGKDTSQFSTEDASGSTSMAASIQESLEAGANTLLYDEDTCAINFLIRDGRMQQLVPEDCEPITPLIGCIRKMWEVKRVSSILVIGGCGDYLDVADTVIGMQEYRALDVTAKANEIAQNMPILLAKATSEYGSIPKHSLDIPAELVSYKPPKAKTKWSIELFPSDQCATASPNMPQQHSGSCSNSSDGNNNNNSRNIGKNIADSENQHSVLDISALDQLVSVSQTRCIALIIRMIAQSAGHKTINEWLTLVGNKTLDELCLDYSAVGDLERPRKIEVALAINRLRYARIWLQSKQQ
ncbi:hypothetical protein GGI25_003103 [Coemansia spiralis]|uniref:Uncharacterized protein n=2 Tax=Coemansia TaxID=4863 RepID=A0A9W8G9C6_9FUNG|nr:hypothetical protein EDC05_001464 [Coemansia umbellata]KAJ2624354.1 hypothetical protein GGI26_001488 [Coemansia sp. RSA 1358]KAJ2677583.1 hypothetical protein GGI25_003103 [Coemansia spiralis]